LYERDLHQLILQPPLKCKKQSLKTAFMWNIFIGLVMSGTKKNKAYKGVPIAIGTTIDATGLWAG